MSTLNYIRGTRARRIALCFALFWLVWSWHFLFALMFLPTMIAFCRDLDSWPSILVVNIFLGWSPVWVLIIAWALWTNNPIPPLPRDAVKVTVNANVNYNRKTNEIKF